MSDEQIIEEEDDLCEKLENLWDFPSVPSLTNESPPPSPTINKKIEAYNKGLYSPGSGEVCAKYFTQSDSEIFKHIYYRLPCNSDPGIEEALLLPEPIVTYPADGRDLYFAICEEMNTPPIRLFYENLLNKTIDLSYYTIDPNGMRPMALALENNVYVEKLIFKETFLNDEACYHLAQMLKKNTTIVELDLEGCRIGWSGIKRILGGLKENKTLTVFKINRNELNDQGAILLGKVFHKIHILQLYASCNNISDDAALAWSTDFLKKNILTLLDISRNNFNDIGKFNKLLTTLSLSKDLQTLDLSWNGLLGQRMKKSLAKILETENLAYLDLSNNRLEGEVIQSMAEVISKAKKLVTLNLSYNPLSPEDACTILTPFQFRRVKVQNLLMDNVIVDKTFIELLNYVKTKRFRKNTVVTHGRVTPEYAVSEPDIRCVLLDRIEFLCKEQVPPIDIALFVYQLIKDGMTLIDVKDFEKMLRPVIDKELVTQLMECFPGPRPKKKDQKMSILNLISLADYLKRKWPERHLKEKVKRRKKGRRRKK